MKLRILDREVLIPPIFAAVAFTIPESIQLMHRADSIYIPIIFEIPLFAISYVAFAIVSVLCFGPISEIALSRGTNYRTGLIFVVGTSLIGTYLLYAIGFFGNKSTIFHQAYIFGSFIPFLALSSGLFYYGKQRIEGATRNGEPRT